MAYRLTDDESYAFISAMLKGVTWGPVTGEDGYVRDMGWKVNERNVDREIRSLLAAGVLTEVGGKPHDLISPQKAGTLVRGPREVDERDWDGKDPEGKS